MKQKVEIELIQLLEQLDEEFFVKFEGAFLEAVAERGEGEVRDGEVQLDQIGKSAPDRREHVVQAVLLHVPGIAVHDDPRLCQIAKSSAKSAF